MKKVLAVTLAIALLVAFASCGGKKEAFTEDLTITFEKLIAKTNEYDDEHGMVKMLLAEGGYGAENKPVEKDSSERTLGMTAEEMDQYVEEAIEMVPNGAWFAHSIILAKLKDGTDVEAVANQILKGTSPSRFGCLKADAISVFYAGNYVMMCATDDTTIEAAYKAFAELSAIEPTRLDRECDWKNQGGGLFMVGQ